MFIPQTPMSLVEDVHAELATECLGSGAVQPFRSSGICDLDLEIHIQRCAFGCHSAGECFESPFCSESRCQKRLGISAFVIDCDTLGSARYNRPA